MSTLGVATTEFSACAACTLRDGPLCEGSRRFGQTQMGRIMRRRAAAAGETLMAQGDPADVVGLVVAGVLRLVKTLPDGRQQIVHLVHPGEFFGRPQGGLADCAVEAATDVSVCVADGRAFAALKLRMPELEHRLVTIAFDDIATERVRSLILGCLDTRERIAAYLFNALARREHVLTGVADPMRKPVAVLQISRQDLASYLATSVETISRTLHEFSRDGVIELTNHDHFTVLNRAELLRLSGLGPEEVALFNRRRLAVAARLTSR